MYKVYKTLICLTIFIFLLGCKEESVNPTVVGDPDNGGLILPDGFEAISVVDSLGRARHMAVNENGDIYVKLGITGGVDGNIAMRDTDGDGKVDVIRRFGGYPNDGKFATEMKIHKGYLYFSTELVVFRQKLTPPELIPTSPLEVIMVCNHPVQWHNAKSLAFDDKGGMYVTFGTPSNVCEDWNSVIGDNTADIKGLQPCPELIEHAGIWKFDEAKQWQQQSDGKRFATGIRSVVGITWNEKDKSLYAMQHGRDYLYGHAPQYYTPWQNATLPAEELVIVKDGDDFGWPTSYYDPDLKKRILAPEYGGNGKIVAQGFKDPIMGMPAHWAPNDIMFYKGNQFPSRYKDGIFMAFHGSTNRNPYPQAGYIVAFVPFKNGKPYGEWEVFADGFAGQDTLTQMADAKYRPVGLAQGPDGSIYVCESKTGRVWRIIYNGDHKAYGDKQLAKMEKRKEMSYLKTPHPVNDNLSIRGNINGESVYLSHCASCHQKDGKGQEGVYPPLYASEWVNGENERLIKSIVHGLNGPVSVNGKTYNREMPGYNFLSNFELVEVINYIKNNFANKGGKVGTNEVAAAR